MKNAKLVILLLLLFIAEKSFAQVGIGSSPAFSPNTKAALDISSNDKGLLIPRMATSQRTGITPTPEGLTVYDTDTKSFWYFDGTNWKEVNSNDIATPVYYQTVWICCNPWMTKNLEVTTYRNGDVIPQVTDNAAWAALTTGAWCYFANSSSNGTIYGKLYNWYAVNDPRGLAPEGWHLPTDFEWETLGTCLGGDAVAGGLIREIGTTHWTTPNNGATDVTGFTALPGGYRHSNGGFFAMGGNGMWWSSTINSALTTSAYIRYMHFNFPNLFKDSQIKNYGYSVRCVKD